MRAATRITRRSVLAAGVVVLGGCTRKPRKSAPPRPTPDAAALEAARSAELDLIAACDALIASAGDKDASALTGQRQAHAAHLAALGGASVRPSPTGTPAAGADIHHLLLASAEVLRSAAVEASLGHDAAVLASIAASHLVLANE